MFRNTLFICKVWDRHRQAPQSVCACALLPPDYWGAAGSLSAGRLNPKDTKHRCLSQAAAAPPTKLDDQPSRSAPAVAACGTPQELRTSIEATCTEKRTHVKTPNSSSHAYATLCACNTLHASRSKGGSSGKRAALFRCSHGAPG